MTPSAPYYLETSELPINRMGDGLPQRRGGWDYLQKFRDGRAGETA